MKILNFFCILHGCYYIHIKGRGRGGRDGMVVGSTTICDKVCQSKREISRECNDIIGSANIVTNKRKILRQSGEGEKGRYLP